MPNRLTKRNKELLTSFSEEYAESIYTRLQELEDMIEAGQLTKLYESPTDKVSYVQVKDLYNDICKSYPKVTKLSDGRKRTIKARFNEGYKLDDFKKLFRLSESSDFLKGKTGSKGRYFHATFDWLIDGNNMVKVIDGNYNNNNTTEHSYDLDKFEQMAYSAKK